MKEYNSPSFPQESELERLTSAREAETKFIREQNELEIDKTKEMAAIETQKFRDMVSAIGPETIASIATSGPDMQVRVTCTPGTKLAPSTCSFMMTTYFERCHVQ